MTNATPYMNLHDINAAKVSTVNIPAVVYIAILIGIGFVGNLLVVFVFAFKVKRRSSYQLFVLVMGIHDLTACSLAMPGLLFRLLNPFTFYSSSGCKILHYGYHVIECSTSTMHALMGIDRYRRICKPFDAQMTLKFTKLILLTQFCMALGTAGPAIILNDSTTVKTGYDSIPGRRCGISAALSDSIYPVLYESVLSVLMVATVTILVMCYVQIGREVYRRSTFLKSVKKQVTYNNSSDTAAQDVMKTVSIYGSNHYHENKINPVEELASEDDTKTIQDSKFDAHATDDEIGIDSNAKDSDTISKDNEKISKQYSINSYNSAVIGTKKKKNIRQKVPRDMTSRRITAVTFTLTLVYMLSYVPVLVLTIISITNSTFVKNMTDSQEAVYNIGSLSYALNNVANPIVYLAIDREFRTNSREILSGIRNKLIQ